MEVCVRLIWAFSFEFACNFLLIIIYIDVLTFQPEGLIDLFR